MSFPSHLIIHFYKFNSVFTNNNTTSESLIFKHLNSLPVSRIAVCCQWILRIFIQCNISSLLVLVQLSYQWPRYQPLSSIHTLTLQLFSFSSLLQILP